MSESFNLADNSIELYIITVPALPKEIAKFKVIFAKDKDEKEQSMQACSDEAKTLMESYWVPRVGTEIVADL